MKIYTKTGDAGETGLLGGDRVKKDSLRITAIGEIDELNAAIGVARTYASGHSLDTELQRIQSTLFDLGAEMAAPIGSKFDREMVRGNQVEELERSIDELESELPPLKNFILPGGSPLAAHLHLARCVCRRAERAVVTLGRAEEIRTPARLFVNRLSDWLFVAARTANATSDVRDVEWHPSAAKELP